MIIHEINVFFWQTCLACDLVNITLFTHNLQAFSQFTMIVVFIYAIKVKTFHNHGAVSQ